MEDLFFRWKGVYAMIDDPVSPREGDLYKTVTVGGHTFELRYGYYEEYERALCPPVVLFPDLIASPLYSSDGCPLVTQIQDACQHFEPKHDQADEWCGDCTYFSGQDPELGICRCGQMDIKMKEEEIK